MSKTTSIALRNLRLDFRLYYNHSVLLNLLLLRHAAKLPLSSIHHLPHLGYKKNEMVNQLYHLIHPWYAGAARTYSLSFLVASPSLISESDSGLLTVYLSLPTRLSSYHLASVIWDYQQNNDLTYPCKENVWLPSLSVIAWSGNHNPTGWTVDVMDRVFSLVTILKSKKNEIGGVHTAI